MKTERKTSTEQNTNKAIWPEHYTSQSRFLKTPAFVDSGNRSCCFHPLAFDTLAEHNCTVKHNSLPCNNIQMFSGGALPLDHKGIPTRSLVLLSLLPQTHSSMFYICWADEFLMADGQGEMIPFSECSHSQIVLESRESQHKSQSEGFLSIHHWGNQWHHLKQTSLTPMSQNSHNDHMPMRNDTWLHEEHPEFTSSQKKTPTCIILLLLGHW